MTNIELLAPAGNMEKLKTAFYYGADACYFAGKQYGLRAFAGNFDDQELAQSVAYAHSLGKKAYITLNIIAHNTDFDNMKQYILYLQSIGADAVIVADVGIIQLIREIAPDLAIHVSTQANITNKYTAQFFANMGVKRLILARELSLDEIREIRDNIPKDIEIETFVHGAMCISYSGRCLLSNYLTGRDSNRGACVQACRWCYTIKEQSRSDEYEIQEDSRGTYILNSKDLCLIEHLWKLIDAGVTSFKIEGRMKTPYYVATVVNAYHRALALALRDKDKYVCPPELVAELTKTSHREYTTGFYFGADNKENTATSRTVQTHDFVAVVTGNNDGVVEIEQRNKFCSGDTLEVLSPSDCFNKQITLTDITDNMGNPVQVANIVQQKLYFKCDLPLHAGDILRKKNKE